jgi:hypothetical protein
VVNNVERKWGAKMFGALPTATLSSERANFRFDVENIVVTDTSSNRSASSIKCVDSGERTSRIETIIPRFALRNWPNAINFRNAQPVPLLPG